MRLAVAQTVVRDDPRDVSGLRESARDLRRLMRDARDGGARLIHFPEGAICSPSKHAMSVDGPDQVGPSDWNRFEWDVMQEELDATAALARELRLWTVVGSAHRLTGPNRPYNSLYVISQTGDVVTRYDERFLSNTKVSYMYTPGSVPITFEVDGFRFGCLLGMEIQFPELFSEYERMDVDGVLFSSTGSGTGNFAQIAQAHAATNNYWLSFSVLAPNSGTAPSGVIAPGGEWLARCSTESSPSVAIAELDESSENLDEPLHMARPWRRKARAGIYEQHLVRDDPRSDDRAAF